MVNKPRRRKQQGHGRAYLTLGIILVLVVGGISYAYAAGLGPFGKQSASTTTPSLLYARVNTTYGSFEIELFNSLTPKTVANFVNLVNQGFYNNLVWHRIAKDFVIQTGDPATRYGGGSRDEWGFNNSGVYVPFEYVPSLHNDEYYLAMASTGAGVGGSSQFYINLGNNSIALDGKWAVFGEVISGMSIVQAIGNAPTETVNLVNKAGPMPEPNPPVYVTSITMINGP